MTQDHRKKEGLTQTPHHIHSCHSSPLSISWREPFLPLLAVGQAGWVNGERSCWDVITKYSRPCDLPMVKKNVFPVVQENRRKKWGHCKKIWSHNPGKMAQQVKGRHLPPSLTTCTRTTWWKERTELQKLSSDCHIMPLIFIKQTATEEKAFTDTSSSKDCWKMPLSKKGKLPSYQDRK